MLLEEESASYALWTRMRHPVPSLPRRLFIKPHVSYDLVIYGATRKRGLIGDDVSSMIPGSFGVAGVNFAPMYNFNNYFSGRVFCGCAI